MPSTSASLGANSAGAILKLVFREAKIHDVILFFDECESIFMDRTKGNLQVNTVLTELERHEGLCILATNRPMDLDPDEIDAILADLPRDQWCDDRDGKPSSVAQGTYVLPRA